MAVWTNGTTIAYYQRQNPNFFKDIPNIPRVTETLAEILQAPFTMKDLINEDKLTKTGKSLKDLVLEMEDEVLANAGVDVFEEVFKLIFAKLYDEQIGATDEHYNLEFRNSGLSDIQLKEYLLMVYTQYYAGCMVEKWRWRLFCLLKREYLILLTCVNKKSAHKIGKKCIHDEKIGLCEIGNYKINFPQTLL